jgi:methylmalonyl-CoA mutase N-terminal domain/subunit
VAEVVDPLGGAFAIEAATDQLEREAERLLDEIESRGGALRAIGRGEIQRWIQESAYHQQQMVESGERVVVGVNRFQEGSSAPVAETLRIDPEAERLQVARLRELRRRRDQAAWRRGIEGVERCAREGGNLLPPLVDAVCAWATVGEIAGTLRRVFGEHQETLVL